MPQMHQIPEKDWRKQLY